MKNANQIWGGKKKLQEVKIILKLKTLSRDLITD